MGRKANPVIIGAFVVGAVALAVAGIVMLGSGRFFADTTERSDLSCRLPQLVLRLLGDAYDDDGLPLFAIMTTAYILIAIRFEERDFEASLGPIYTAYRRRVPMLIPRLAPRRP
ncbi:MAG: hypothetical protein IT293_11625 [Deltaproteobacteria bacterium]|nr:hypothetical protein [Deltaproteobacteria bacterium]